MDHEFLFSVDNDSNKATGGEKGGYSNERKMRRIQNVLLISNIGYGTKITVTMIISKQQHLQLLGHLVCSSEKLS